MMGYNNNRKGNNLRSVKPRAELRFYPIIPEAPQYVNEA